MTDLALVWTTMNDDDVTASREQVRDWAQELSLPAGTLTKTSTLGAFRKAHAATVVHFEDPAAGPMVMRSHQVGKSREVVKYDVLAHPPQQESGQKVAELKLFQQRRTSRGVVRGSQQWKAVVKPALEGPYKDAADQWVASFRRTYNGIAVDAPAGAVRRIARLGLLTSGIVVLNRIGLYLFYVDQLDVVHRVEEFLGRCVSSVDVAVIPILPGLTQMRRFAESADAHMVDKVSDFAAAIHGWAGRSFVTHLSGDMAARFTLEAERLLERIEEHERRLSSPLPHARSLLSQATHLLSSYGLDLDLPVHRSEWFATP